MFLRNAYSRARYVRGVMFARVRRVLRGMRLHKKFLLGHQPCPSNKNFFAQLETEGQNYEKTFLPNLRPKDKIMKKLLGQEKTT